MLSALWWLQHGQLEVYLAKVANRPTRLMAVQEAESQRSAPTDTASSDGGSTLDAAARGARGARLPVDEYAAWMGTYPGMVFKLPTSRGARRASCLSHIRKW